MARRRPVPDLSALVHGHERRRRRRPARRSRRGSTICSGSASTASGSTRSRSSPNDDWGYDVADYCDVDPSSARSPTPTSWSPRPRARGIRVLLDLVPNHTSDRAPVVRRRRGRRATPRTATGTCGPTRSPTASPPNNWVERRSAVRRGRSTRRPASTTCTSSSSSSPTSTGGTRTVRERVRRHPAVLVRPRRRRLPHRRCHMIDQGPRAARQPARDRRRPLVRRR